MHLRNWQKPNQEIDQEDHRETTHSTIKESLDKLTLDLPPEVFLRKVEKIQELLPEEARILQAGLSELEQLRKNFEQTRLYDEAGKRVNSLEQEIRAHVPTPPAKAKSWWNQKERVDTRLIRLNQELRQAQESVAQLKPEHEIRNRLGLVAQLCSLRRSAERFAEYRPVFNRKMRQRAEQGYEKARQAIDNTANIFREFQFRGVLSLWELEFRNAVHPRVTSKLSKGVQTNIERMIGLFNNETIFKHIILHAGMLDIAIKQADKKK